MKKSILPLLLILLITGCASSDRMLRMSGGVLDEYSAPHQSRIRSTKYQQVSRELSSTRRANKTEVSGMDDTLINIWPFFFRSNDYWSALWPLIDSDPYGFAFRPFYNHEGDDYSILFPLSAWNLEKGHGWITLFGWNCNGFGVVPLTWQWHEQHSGGAYYTPLFIYSYDNTPLEYTVIQSKSSKDHCSTRQQWQREEISLWAFLFHYGRDIRVKQGKWEWLYDIWYHNSQTAKNKALWNYKFNGQKPFPPTETAFENFRSQIFATLPREYTKYYGFFPLWLGTFHQNGNWSNRFMLLAGNSKEDNNFEFDIMGDIIAGYEQKQFNNIYACKSETSFTSWVLLSYFSETENYKKNGTWAKLDAIHRLILKNQPFSQKKPALSDALKQLDPSLTIPPLVVDDQTMKLYFHSLRDKYDLPTETTKTGRILPLLWYKRSPQKDYTVLPALLTWWDRTPKASSFNSIPLMTFVKRSPEEDSTVIMTPLVYYAKEQHRKRSEFSILPRSQTHIGEYECAELNDRYAACGLFYRGRFGFNVAKPGINAKIANSIRLALRNMYRQHSNLNRRAEAIKKERSRVDRWQTNGRIEHLRKLIRYEELKQQETTLARDREKFNNEIAEFVAAAKSIGFVIQRSAFEKRHDAETALAAFMDKYTELRFFEDIGSGLIFNRQNYYNGDHHWHFMHILAGGEKSGERESQHILHLLYRYRKEGKRSEKIIFPFISIVRDGDDSRVSFLWRLFSISKRQGKTGGYIFFIPFGKN